MVTMNGSLTFQCLVWDHSPEVGGVERHVAEVSQGGGQLDEEVAGQHPHHCSELHSETNTIEHKM